MKTKLKCKTCSSYKLTWNLFVFCRPGRKAPSCDGGQVRKKWPSHRIATGNLLRLDNAILIVSSLDHAYLVFFPYSFKPLWPFLKGARSPFADLEKISLIFFQDCRLLPILIFPIVYYCLVYHHFFGVFDLSKLLF